MDNKKLKFLIRDDPVQVDKAIYAMRCKLVLLREHNKQLAEENERLKNRPDDIYNLPTKRQLLVKRPKEKIDMSLLSSKWQTAHFIKFFQELYSEKYGVTFKIKGKAWQAYAFRIKQFRDAHPEIKDNSAYKNMVEWLFKRKFNRTFVASIPLISTDSMFYQWLAATQEKRETTPEEFREIASSIPKSSDDIRDIINGAF